MSDLIPDDLITLDYGSGGKKTASLIERLFLPLFGNEALAPLGDAAVLPGADKLVFSTDSFVVRPYFFPGGNIGKLAVCGTVNDLAVAGGEAKFLSLAYILEEGLPNSDLEKITESVARTAASLGVRIVTGDTKVVEKGRGDGIYINTAGIGYLITPGLSPSNLRAGDAVLVSGPVGEHGTAVMLARSETLLQADLLSDCAPVKEPAEALGALAPALRVMRDPTRGGVATTLNEFIERTPLGIELNEEAIPISAPVRSACEILGLDPLYCACEGRLLAVVAPEKAEEALAILRRFHPKAALIGRVSDAHPGLLTVKTKYGGYRIASKLSGAQLPRIC